MKPSIDEQIEAVTAAKASARLGVLLHENTVVELEAALATLKWVKRYAPTIKTLREQFPDATFVDRREDE